MIVTVTPNPSFDRTLHVNSVEIGEVHRASSVTLEAGGKGINVARAIANAGSPARTVFPGGLADSEHFASLLSGIDYLDVLSIDVGRALRVNTTVVETDGRTTKLNESGDTLTDEAQSRLFDATAAAATDASWIAVCGSLPPGAEPDFALRLHEHVGGNAKLAVDASGEPLARIAAAGCDLIKPNHEELEELVGQALPTLGHVVDAATELQRSGIDTVVVSLGGDGALLVNGNDVIHAAAPSNRVENTVGAGDAFLAGFLAGGGSGIHALSEALAWGRAAVSSPSTAFPPATDEDRAAIQISSEIDRAMSLADEGE